MMSARRPDSRMVRRKTVAGIAAEPLPEFPPALGSLAPIRKRSGSVGSEQLLRQLPARPSSALSLSAFASSHNGGRSASKAKTFKTNFCVTVRVRPPLERELGSKGASKCVEVLTDESNAVVIRKPRERAAGPPSLLDVDDFAERLTAAPEQLNDVHTFAYDQIFGMRSGQEEVYTTCARDIVHSVLSGYNGSIIAYGQTSTGKTHTIEGGRDGEARGVIPRCCEEIFDYIQNPQSSSSKFLVRTSFLEIYNEQVMDLLEPGRTSLKVRETPSHGMFVDGLSEKVVRTSADVLTQLQKGSTVRKTNSTRMNKMSSRSHAVFTMIVEQSHLCGTGKGRDVTIGKLRLVDLAGSERFEADAKGKHIEETKNINLSLYTFGKVILELTTSSSKHVPYRDSKLTRILQDSLGGNCKTTMISTISPMSTSYLESLNTLKFAQRAKLVKNVASVNKDTTQQALLSNYEKEIQKLREELLATKSTNVDRDEVLQLEKDHQQAQQEKDAAVRRLKQQQKEIAQAEAEKQAFMEKIDELEKQVLQGGMKIEETVEFREAVRKEHHRLQVEAQQKMMKLELQRKRLEREKEEFELQKRSLSVQSMPRPAPDGGCSDEEDGMEGHVSSRYSRSPARHYSPKKTGLARSPSPEDVQVYPTGTRMVVGASATSSTSLRSAVSGIDVAPSAASLKSSRTTYSHDSHFAAHRPGLAVVADGLSWSSPGMVGAQGAVPLEPTPTRELLDYAYALSNPTSGIPTQNHPLGVRVFSSDIAARWFLANMEGIHTVPAAEAVGQRLIDLGVIHNITGTVEFVVSQSELYYFAEKAEHPQVRRQRPALQPIKSLSSSSPGKPLTLESVESLLSLASSTSSRRAPTPSRQLSSASGHSAHSVAETLASSGSNDSNASQEMMFDELKWPDFGSSPIHTTAARGDRRSLQKLTRQLSANCLDSGHRTPLMYAAAANQLKCCQQLIRDGGDQNIGDDRQITPLLVAAMLGHDVIVKYLLKYLRASRLPSDASSRNLLHHSAAQANLRCLEVVLNHPLARRSINERDSRFYTPLHVAVVSGHANHSSLLLASKAELTTADNRGQTALHCAILAQQQHCVEVLVAESSGHLNMADAEGRTPLHIACMENSASIVSILLNSKRCDVDVVDSKRMTGLHMAVHRSQLETVQLLIAHGAKLTLRDHRGRIPLHYAQEQRNPGLVTLLQKSAGVQSRVRIASRSKIAPNDS